MTNALSEVRTVRGAVPLLGRKSGSQKGRLLGKNQWFKQRGPQCVRGGEMGCGMGRKIIGECISFLLLRSQIVTD